jgi:hypothetical protein
LRNECRLKNVRKLASYAAGVNDPGSVTPAREAFAESAKCRNKAVTCGIIMRMLVISSYYS